MGRYKSLGVGFDREFRNNYNENVTNIEKDVDKSLADSSIAKQKAEEANMQVQSVETVANQAKEKTDFLVVGKNLFNKDTAITGYYINQNSGDLIALAGYISSDFIRVRSGVQYTVNSIRKFAIYDNSYTYISGVDTGGSNYTFTPAQDGYIRFSYQPSIINTDEVQLEKGAIPSTPEPFAVSVKWIEKPKTGSVKLSAYGNKYDIKSDFSDSEEINIRTTKNGSANGSFNFQETLVGGKKIHSTQDDITPVRTFATVGGNHGYTTVFQITNNGKTSFDIGSQWSDGTTTYVLLQIKGSNLIFGCPYTEVSGKVTSAYVAPTAPLTNVSGATNTTSIPLTGVANTQLYPSTGRKNVEYRVDGKLITSGGDYYGEKVEVIEVYDILDYKAIIEYAKAAKADFANTVDTIAGVLQISNRFTFTKGGRCSTSTSIRALKPVDLGRTGTMQSVWLNSSGYTTKRYVPNVKPKSGIDFVNVVDMTNYATTVLVTSADLVNPAIPPSRYVDYLEDGSGNKQYAFTMGYILDKTNSKHADRLANVSSTLWEFRDSKKSYPTVLEGKSLATGDYYTFQGFRNYFKPTSNMLIEDKVADDSAVYLYLDRLNSTSYNNTNFPNLLGKKLTVIESSGFTLLNDTFDANGINYKFTSNNGYAVLKAQ